LSRQDAPRRIVIVGSTGCGKSTLARTLSRETGLPHLELDTLYYEPRWQKAPDQQFYDTVAQHAGTNEWIIDGNYETVRDIVWVRAQTLIWLDYPLRLVLWRLLKRTIHRLLTGTAFANGNRESFGRVLGRNSVFLWAIRSYGPRRRKLQQLLANRRYSHLSVQRFRSPGEVNAWLRRKHD